MTGWIIYDRAGYERNKWFAQRMCEATGGSLIITEDLEFGINGGVYYRYKGRELSSPDFAVQRCIFPFLSQVLEGGGARVFNNSRVCDVCNDKRKTHLLADSLGIPSLKTAFGSKSFFNAPDFPFVLKGAEGHGGSEVFFVKNEAELKEGLDKIHSDGFLFQKPASQMGVDKRAYVLGGKIIACVERRAREGFKSNFSLGGEAALKAVTLKEEKIVSKIVSALNPDFVGVDFVYEAGEPYLNEVEDIVGARMLYALTDLDAAALYGDYIIRSL